MLYVADSKGLHSLLPAGAHVSAPGSAARPRCRASAERPRRARARRMVAAFGSGVAFSLVSGMATGANPLQGAFTTGVFFALFQGAFHKARACPNPTLRRCCIGDRPLAPDTCEHCAALPGQFDRATLAAPHFGAELQLHPGSCHARVHWRRHAQVYKYEAECDGCVGAAPQLGQRFSGGGKESPEYARGNYLLRTLGMQAGP